MELGSRVVTRDGQQGTLENIITLSFDGSMRYEITLDRDKSCAWYKRDWFRVLSAIEILFKETQNV